MFYSQESSSAAAVEPNDHDVVLIKEETAKEEVNDHDATDKLLFTEDGRRSDTVKMSKAININSIMIPNRDCFLAQPYTLQTV